MALRAITATRTWDLLSTGVCGSPREATTSAKSWDLLHGTQGRVRTLLDSRWFAAVVAAWATVYGVPEPVTIAVSFGETWTTSDLPSRHVPGSPNLFRFFTDQLMPYVETGALPAGTVPARSLLGQSMGSYNAGGLVTRRPDLFSKAALTCPAWFPISKFSPPAHLAAYLARNPLSDVEAVVFGLHLLGRDEGTDPIAGMAAWRVNDPLELVMATNTRLQGASPPRFLVAYNLADTYGFAEGAELFSTRARNEGFEVETLFNAARHCDITPDMSDAIARFLQ